jgi:D-alanyl-D-alanine-carboxypeptidase/D-alanyl-D-alanine-endopeptidase
MTNRIPVHAVSGGRAAFGDVPVPSEAELRKILVQRIDEERQSVGVVVGLLESTGRRLVSHGELERGDPRPLTGDTIFEIGSVTKVFTALLLMDMVERGEVALSDPVAMYLPAGITVPQRNGRQITLRDLATHRSGLPRLPSNFLPTDSSNPYADYGVEQLYAFLSCYELPRDIDSQVEYSNLGFGLLGHALERRAGLDYESLVRARILDPLGMSSSTRIALTPEMKTRLCYLPETS